MIRPIFAGLALLLLSSGANAADATATPTASFEDVKPVFRKHCQACHNPDRPRGDLDLSTFAATMTGGSSGKAVVVGKATDSLLYNMSAHLEDPKMPPGKPKIPEGDLLTIKRWIEGGLKERASSAATAVAAIVPPPAPAVEKATIGLKAISPLNRKSAITALAASPTAPLVALPGVREVLIYDTAASKFLGALAFPEGEVHSLKFSADGRTLIAGGGVGGESGKVVGFDVASWKRTFAVGDELDAAMACDLSADGKTVALGGPLRTVKVISVADGKVLHTLRKPTDWVTSVAFSPEGLLLAGADRFGGVFVWEAASGKEFAVLRGHTKAATAIAWQADSNALATASEDGTVRVWNLHTLAESARFTAHEGGVSDLKFHASGLLITSGRDGRMRTWDATGKRIAESAPMGDHVTRVAVSGDAKSVVGGDWSGNLRKWSLTGEPDREIVRPLIAATRTAVAILPDAPRPLPAEAKPVARTEVPRTDTAMVEARRVAEAATARLGQSERDLIAARKAVASNASLAALAYLKLALASDPDNPAIRKAVAEAEAAVKSLSQSP